MQADSQADGVSGGAASAAGLGAALDAAFAMAERGNPTAVSEADASAVAELLVRGLASTDAGVAWRAARAIARFAWGGLAAARAVAEASGGAAMPALARLATTGDGAASSAAIAAVASLMTWQSKDDRDALSRAYAATDGAVEALIKAIMQQATPVNALRCLAELIYNGGPEVSAQVAAADGLCARLVWFVAAVDDGPWQPGDSGQLRSCFFAMACICALMLHEPEAVTSVFVAAEGLWPALERLVCAGSSPEGVRLDSTACDILLVMAEHSPAAARRAAGQDRLLAGLAAALTRPECRERADEVLQAVLTRGNGKAAIAAAAAGALAAATNEAARQQLREWLAAPPMEMEAAAISALERQALEAAALRARVAELEAIPVNTRAALVELAQAVRSKRLREEAVGAAGKKQKQ